MTRIEYLELRNYRLFRHAKWSRISAFTVVVGANGSGKSTLFDALSFLKECLAENVAQAVTRRGGLRELVSRGASEPVLESDLVALRLGVDLGQEDVGGAGHAQRSVVQLRKEGRRVRVCRHHAAQVRML